MEQAKKLEHGRRGFDISALADKLESSEIQSQDNTLRQSIINEYPRIHRMMKEKKLTRKDVYAQFCEMYGTDAVSEGTFYNYLLAGKHAMIDAEKQAKKANKTVKLPETAAPEQAPLVQTEPDETNNLIASTALVGEKL